MSSIIKSKTNFKVIEILCSINCFINRMCNIIDIIWFIMKWINEKNLKLNLYLHKSYNIVVHKDIKVIQLIFVNLFVLNFHMVCINLKFHLDVVNKLTEIKSDENKKIVIIISQPNTKCES